MASTVNNIIDAAVERSNLNDEDLITAAQLYKYVSNYERLVYMLAARGNPDFFGKEANTASRSFGGTWNIDTTPGNVGAISRLEVATIVGSVGGISVEDEVSLISIRNPLHGLAPRVYMRNRVIYPYDDELSDNASNYVQKLKVYYSHMPSERTSGSETLDLPSEFDDLLIIPLARLLAIRDQRPDEVAPLDAEYQLALTTFINHLGVFDEGTIRDLKAIAASAVPSVSPGAQSE